MFVGHLAVAFGAKAATPRAPLSGLIAASFGLDLIWPICVLAGVRAGRGPRGHRCSSVLPRAGSARALSRIPTQVARMVATPQLICRGRYA
jgi:hypothetical protein